MLKVEEKQINMTNPATRFGDDGHAWIAELRALMRLAGPLISG